MAYPFEISVKPGATDAEISVEVLDCLEGGQPIIVAPLDVAALIAACETLEGAVPGSVEGSEPESSGEQLLQDVGRQLFDAVFSGEVGGAFRSSYAVASDRNAKLRVVLRLSDPRLASLPWEAMYDSRHTEFVCCNEPLVRHVAASGVPIPLPVKPPLRILGLVSSPSDLPPLAVDEEKARLSDALAGLERKELVFIEWVDQPDWESVHAKLRDETWHVLHFIGHGEYDDEADEGTIALVHEDGRSHMVDAARFADLLNQGSSRPRLVVLNSCQSGRTGTRDVFASSAATLVRRGTSAVAAMQFTVSDESAVKFARGFYDSLAKGGIVDEAVQSGRVSILGGGSLEWVTPVLYVRGETSQLFDLKSDSPGRVGRSAGTPVLLDDGPVPPDNGSGPRVWTMKSVVIAAALAVLLVVLAIVATRQFLPIRGDVSVGGEVTRYPAQQAQVGPEFVKVRDRPSRDGDLVWPERIEPNQRLYVWCKVENPNDAKSWAKPERSEGSQLWFQVGFSRTERVGFVAGSFLANFHNLAVLDCPSDR
jgi:hypothetical protein